MRSRFKIQLSDKLLPQTIITLNLMQSSHFNPLLSAYAQVQGHFDYNRNPLALPGIKVMTHVNPDVRGSWDDHAVETWYTGPVMYHYRCYRI